VATRDAEIEFTKCGTSAAAVTDEYGGEWTWHGDPAPLDLQQDGRHVSSGQYPNAFERIAGALDLDRSGELWVTARPGYEFEVPGGEAHIGGASHGALHALDSLSPVVIAGAHARALPRRRHPPARDVAAGALRETPGHGRVAADARRPLTLIARI
jgi:hypothetical protein